MRHTGSDVGRIGRVVRSPSSEQISPSGEASTGGGVPAAKSASMLAAQSRGVTPTKLSTPKLVFGLGRRSKTFGGGLSMITDGSPDQKPMPHPAIDGIPALGGGSFAEEGPEDDEKPTYSLHAHRQNVECRISHDPLRAVSQSPDGKRLVTGGQEVLSIINTSQLTDQGGEVEVEFNILQRTLMGGGRSSKQHKVWDVRWHPNEMSAIASTSDDGLVSLWKLDGANIKIPAWEGRDDTRSCWRLAWCQASPSPHASCYVRASLCAHDPRPGACVCPHASKRAAGPPTQPEGGTNVLCSGSLDGIVRLWDFRIKQSVANFILGGHHDGSMQLGQGASGLKVRDLRVCGAQPWKLAAGMESNNEGDVVVWDLRSNIKPIFRKREETAVHAVDWHPEHPSILATGRTATHYAPGGIKVWDLNMASTGADLLPIAKIITPGMPPRGCMIRVRMLKEPCFARVGGGLSVELLTADGACCMCCQMECPILCGAQRFGRI